MSIAAILDRQHVGRVSKLDDLGASPGPNLLDHEGMQTAVYLRHAELTLRQQGKPVVPMSDGAYDSRHRRAIQYAKAVPGRRWAYVAAHLNAGGGDYGLVGYDHRSTAGRQLAEAIAAALEEHCPELARVVVQPVQPTGWTRDMYATISGIYAGPSNLSAVCFEPCFLDQPDHAPLLTPDGLRRIGLALAEGIGGWAT